MKKIKQKCGQFVALLKKFTLSYKWLGVLGYTVWWTGLCLHTSWEFVEKYLPW